MTSRQDKTRDEWFKKGIWLERRDTHRGANEGLNARERKALADENSKPWGQTWWAEDAVKKRVKEAQKLAQEKKNKADKAKADKAAKAKAARAARKKR